MTVSFEKVGEFVSEVAKICQERKFSGIYAPPRGGLIFGVWLSHKTGLPLLIAPAKDCIIIDDIADTGATLERYAGKYFIATMYYHKQCSFTPDFWMVEKGCDWIVYPWEE